MKRLKLTDRGDTILEVLIAVTVISMVLVGAFIVTQKSNFATRGSQEHSEAQKIAEGQLEALRALADSHDTQMFLLNTFCVKDGVTATTGCVFKADGTAAPAGFQPAYDTSITRSPCSPAPTIGTCGVYMVQVQWDNAAGNGKDQVSMAYRLYGGN